MKKSLVYCVLIVVGLFINLNNIFAQNGVFAQKNGSAEIKVSVRSSEDSTALTDVLVSIFYHTNSNERLLKDGSPNKDYIPKCELITTKKLDRIGMISLLLVRDRNFKITFSAKGKIPQSFYIDTWFLPIKDKQIFSSLFYMKSCKDISCEEDLSYFRIVRYDKNKERIASSDVIVKDKENLKQEAEIFDFESSKGAPFEFNKTQNRSTKNLFSEKDKIGIIDGTDTLNVIDNQLLRQGKWRLFDEVKNLFSKHPNKPFYEGIYKNDKKEGKWLVNTALGKKRLSFLFDKGSFQKQVEIFDKSQNQQVFANYDTISNHFVGELKTFYESGQVELELNLNDSAKKEGTQLAYYKEGNVAVMSTYKDNLKDGVTLLYTQEGILGLKQTYKAGKLISEDKFADSKTLKEAFGLIKQIDRDFTDLEIEVGTALRTLGLSEEEYISTISAQFIELKQSKDELENQQKLMLKSKQELEIEKLESKLKTEELQRSRVVLIGSFIALLFSFLMLFILLRQSKERKRVNELLSLKNHEISEKKQEIIDSIQYAKRLQSALMPPLEIIQNQIPQSFLFFRPKDIVSGDFYWFEQVGDATYMAIADCTGHGVPGAIVSMICHTALSRSILEFSIQEPGEILNKTAELVTATFNKSSNSEVKDGMDISLVCINKKSKTMSWAGANNSIYWIEHEEIKELKGDKQPIGLNHAIPNFTTHSIAIDSVTTYYMITDGIVDQFGGEKGKKFKSSNFKKVLLDIYKKPILEQEKTIASTFDTWKGDFEQVDDVSVFGFKLG